MLAGVLLVTGPWPCGLPELQYLDASVRPLPDLDRHVLRAEGAPDAHPAMFPVDQVALKLCKTKKKFRYHRGKTDINLMSVKGVGPRRARSRECRTHLASGAEPS